MLNSVIPEVRVLELLWRSALEQAYHAKIDYILQSVIGLKQLFSFNCMPRNAIENSPIGVSLGTFRLA